MRMPAIGAGAAILGALLMLGAGARAQEFDCSSMLAVAGEPKHVTQDAVQQRLCRGGYAVSHDNTRKVPSWVLERLTPERFKGAADRNVLGNPFAEDPDLPENARAKPSDYTRSGYDRGHMAPAADMKDDVTAMRQSFLMSNMAPQVGQGLNRHIWAYLEDYVRRWTCLRDELIVITGPIFEGERRTIGTGQVAVPAAFYKIVYDPLPKRAIAFVLPNAAVSANRKNAHATLAAFRATIDEIELRTGIDFLTALSPRDQRRVEAMKAEMWPDAKACEGT